MNWCPYSQTLTPLWPAKCRRCGGFGHLEKTCNEPVPDPEAPSPAPPKPKRSRNKHGCLSLRPLKHLPLLLPPSQGRSRRRCMSSVQHLKHLPLLQPPSQGRSQRRCMLSLLLLKHPSKHHRAN
ncbi:hypothetical protein PAHAL_5G395800 [Panicum hallii]|uniref:CCHC-type domain-containing protein n=1 Tax=Panicum hallii TaxID=206008 RepID=A0A2T8IMR0_9POAL|nr:hypothetical protein PAHAL_5G395800 [Panicum hallii]